MNRSEKLALLQKINAGQSEALKVLAEQKLMEKIGFAIEQCKLPFLQYIAHRLGEPDEKLELQAEFVQGIKYSKNNDEVLTFVQSFEEKHRQEIVSYVQKMDEYYKSRWQVK